MALYYNAGKLLLRSTDLLWYFIDVDLNLGIPYLRIAQDPTTPPDPEPSAAAIILAGDNNYYDFSLSTVDGVIYASFIVTGIGPADTVTLRGTNGQNYLLRLSLFGGQIYIELVATTVIGVISLPWRGIVLASEDLTKRRSLVPVTTQMFTTVLTPVSA